MKKKTNVKQIIRKIVREEVAMAIQEVITELKKPNIGSAPQQKQITEAIGKEVTYSKNSVLNEVLNETANAEEWKTMGGSTFDSTKMNQVMSSQYGDLMNGNTGGDIQVDGQQPDFLKKDYSKLVKKMNEQPQGKIQKKI